MSKLKDFKKVWVDLGDIQFSMSVIPEHPKKWKDTVTGSFIAPEYRHRFKPYIDASLLDKIRTIVLMAGPNDMRNRVCSIIDEVLGDGDEGNRAEHGN